MRSSIPIEIPVKSVQRIAFMDVARSLGLATVIVGHVLILFATRPSLFDPAAFSVTRFIYAFHMPLFFFLSGVMYRPRGIGHAVTSGLILILLAAVTHLVGLGLAVLITGRDVGLRTLLEPFLLLRSFSLGVTWFLVSIAIVRVLHASLVEGRRRFRVGAALLIVTSFVITMTFDTRAFQIHTWWAGVLFYAAGHGCAGFLAARLNPRGSMAWGRGVLAVVFLASVIVTAVLAQMNLGCTTTPFRQCGSAVLYDRFMVRMTGAQYGFVPLSLVAAFAGTVCIMSAAALLAYLPNKWLRPLVWTGRNTLTLLLLNGCFLVAFNPMIRTLTEAQPWAGWPWVMSVGALVLHVAVLPFAIPVVSALERGLSWVVSQANGLFAVRPAVVMK